MSINFLADLKNVQVDDAAANDENKQNTNELESGTICCLFYAHF